MDYSPEDYNKVMETNLESCYQLCRQVYPFLKKADGSSSIVNVGSVAGGIGISIKSGVVYAMTKAAMNQLTFNLACEWATDGIRVNCIAPWYIGTPLALQVLQDPDYLKSVLDRTPMKRIGKG